MKRYKLLIVDDEALIRSGLRARIAFFGFPDLDVEEAGSGAEALERFRAGDYAIAIVDISMPDMSGLELIAQAKALGARTRFVLLSGYAEFRFAQEGIRLGVRAYLNKPVSNDALRGQIEELLEELRAEAQASAPPDAERELNQILAEGVRARAEEAYPALWARCPQAFGGGWLYLGILHISAPGARAQAANAREAVRGALQQAPCGCGLLVTDCYANAQRLYALFFSDRRDGLRTQVERVFLAVRQSMERRMKVRLTLGVSRLCCALGSECESDARAALRQRQLYGRSNLYFFEDIPDCEAQPFPEADLELLRKHIQRGDRAAIRCQLEALFSEERVHGGRAMYLHMLWVRVVGMMLGAFNGLDDVTMNHMLTQISRVESIGDRDELLNSLNELLNICLRRESGHERNTADKIGYALDYIREHFNEEIVINDLAARLDMSPGYFSSMFKKEVHQSTMQYITGLRIERAREYLERTDQSVAVIAKSVGYEDSQYFFRVFKKATGMTPLQYRQSLKKAAGKPPLGASPERPRDPA